MSQNYTANVDGSFHTKSNIGGWGFIIKDEAGQTVHSNSGAVPNEFNCEYEQYAFAQMISYAINQNIQKIHVKTDLMIMARRFSEMSFEEIVQYIQKFNLNIPYKEIEFSIEYISRKFNKEADALSKSHIYELFSREKKEILENCYPYGHKNLNFLQLPKTNYGIRSTTHDVVNRVFHALKRNHIFVQINEQISKYECFRYVDSQKCLLKEGVMSSDGQGVENFFSEVFEFTKGHGRVVFIVSTEELYNQMIGYSESVFSPSQSTSFTKLIENINEVYVYHDKKKKKNTPKRSRSLKNEIQKLSPQDAIKMLRKNNSKKIRQMMISVYIYEFQNEYGRSPNQDEIQEIIKSVDTP